jgi:hypothetical protein
MVESGSEKSTIVRTPLPLRQRVVRTAFGILERRAPRLAQHLTPALLVAWNDQLGPRF